MKAQPAVALAIAVIAVTAGEALAAPAVEEYIPRAPKAKGNEAPRASDSVPAPETPQVAGASTAPIVDELVPRGYRESPSETGSVEADDRSALSAFLGALLDPIVLAVGLAALGLAATMARLRPAS